MESITKILLLACMLAFIVATFVQAEDDSSSDDLSDTSDLSGAETYYGGWGHGGWGGYGRGYGGYYGRGYGGWGYGGGWGGYGRGYGGYGGYGRHYGYGHGYGRRHGYWG